MNRKQQKDSNTDKLKRGQDTEVLADEVERLTDKAQDLSKVFNKLGDIAKVAVKLKGPKGDQGEPGETPVKGKDYFTAREVHDFKMDVTPVRGEDYFTKSDIEAFKKSITPITGSGVYTPTRSAEVNHDADATMSEAQYMRVGSMVTVSGRFTFNPTLTATTTSFEMTLPIVSNIGAVEDVSGVAFCGNIASMGAEIIGVVANDTAKVFWVASDINSQTWSYTFSYKVI